MKRISTTTVRHAARRRPARRGVLTVELVLTLPILLMVVFASIEFGILLMANQAVSAAAAVGAREATLPSATPEAVTAAVQRALADWKLHAFLDPVDIKVNGEDQSNLPLADAATGDTIAVTVSVASKDAAPNLLKYVGISLEGQKVSSTIVMRKE